MSQKARAFRLSALRLLRGTILIGVVTAVCYQAQLNAAPTALLFLIAVVLQSLDCSFLEAAVISVLATASLDCFFTEPLYSFAVSGPLEAVTLICLLIVSLVITRIQYRSRAEASESKLQRANMESVYKVSQELLALSPPTVAGPLQTPRICRPRSNKGSHEARKRDTETECPHRSRCPSRATP